MPYYKIQILSESEFEPQLIGLNWISKFDYLITNYASRVPINIVKHAYNHIAKIINSEKLEDTCNMFMKGKLW